MAHRIMLIPAGFGVGLSSVTLGLIHACQQQGINVGHFKPISQPSRNARAKNNSQLVDIEASGSIALSYVEQQMGDGRNDIVLEQIVEKFNAIDKAHDVVIIEGEC